MIKIGKCSGILENIYLQDKAVVVGKKEYEGPLGKYFDKYYIDNLSKLKSFETAEIQMLKDSIDILRLKNNDFDLVIGGDLNNQIAITNYVMKNYPKPFLGIYAACATFVENIIVGSSFIENKLYNQVLLTTVSNNSTSERQFRNPTEYGGQKKECSTYTITAAASLILTNTNKTNFKFTRFTIGKVCESFITDPSDLGRAMAISATNTLIEHLEDFNIDLNEYDLILTGDLSLYGKELFDEILIKTSEKFKNIKSIHQDCGLLIYDINKQNVYAGGSGVGCISAVTLSYIINQMENNIYKKVVLIATGALLNQVMSLQKRTIPCISHLVVLERI